MYNIFISNFTTHNSNGRDTGLVVFEYDSMHRLTYSKTFRGRNNLWELDTLKKYSYDSGGAFMTTQVTQLDTVNGNFIKTEDDQARYDSSGHALYKHQVYYNGAMPSDVTHYYTYGASGRIIVSGLINNTDNTGDKYIYHYNKAGKDSNDIIEAFNGMSWANITMTKSFYDSANRPKLVYTYQWNTSTSAWGISTRDSIVYDTFGWSIYNDYWNASVNKWAPNTKIIDTGTFLSYCSTGYSWNGTKYYRMLDAETVCYIYNKAGILLQVYTSSAGSYYINHSWQYDSITSRIIYSDLIDNNNESRTWYYYYKKYNAIQSAGSSQLKVALYPNPSNGQFEIRFPENTTGTIDICSVTGQIIQRRNFTAQKSVAFHDILERGMYFLQVYSDKGYYAGKFTISE